MLSFGGFVVGFAVTVIKILFWIAAAITVVLSKLGSTIHRASHY